MKVTLKNIITGQFLTNSNYTKYSKELILVFFGLLLYINNQFAVEELMVEQQRMKNRLSVLQTRSIYLQTELFRYMKLSEYLEEAKKRGISLRKSSTPPIVIKRDE